MRVYMMVDRSLQDEYFRDPIGGRAAQKGVSLSLLTYVTIHNRLILLLLFDRIEFKLILKIKVGDPLCV